MGDSGGFVGNDCVALIEQIRECDGSLARVRSQVLAKLRVQVSSSVFFSQFLLLE